uniref:Uncharacterized protein n=1 Tax=Amphimedon queenslandica TaxID=400682 RepID=A0A1X7UYJ8_AMPQE
MWGGAGSGVHYDMMEVYHLPTGAWDQKPTTGTPPPGTYGYSSVAIGKDIYYFGGGGYENSLHCLNVDSFKWRELSPSSSDCGPMKKAYSEMVSAHFDGEDYLVIIGGSQSSSINAPTQPDAQYKDSYGYLRCNEIHYYRISSEYNEKRKAKVAEIFEEKTQVEEKKQIITEDYEKLKLKVTDMEEQYLKEKQIIIFDNQNLISEKDKVIAKLTSNEKQIITDLRAKLSDNESYTTKLMKEKSQLQEKVTFLEEQSMKKTSSIGLQFNYLIPSMDSLDSSVIIAGQKLFILQGDRSHSLQWEKYGFRLECPQGAVSKDTEVAVTALAGGNFKVPK